MKEPRIDDERMSALLEGKVQGDRRDELLKELATSDDDYDVFAETASVLRELEDAEAGVVRLPVRKEGAPVWVRWGAIAAVLAAIALVPVLAPRGAAADPVRLAALVDAREGLPEGWQEDRWRSMRGGGESSEADARAVRAGVMLMDLAVAVEARDSGDTHLLAVQVRRRHDPQSGSAGTLGQIASRAGAPADSLRPLVERATERLAERLGEDHLRLGAWVEAARLAAGRRHEAFFRDRASRAALARAERLTRDDPPALAAVARVRAAIPPEGAPDWIELSRSLDTLLTEVAS